MNLNNKADLLEFLLSIEYSLYSPIAERVGKKICPYCAQFKAHDPECGLNECILFLMDNTFDKFIKEYIHKMLGEIEWCGYHKVCPSCHNQKGSGHTETCGFNQLTRR